MQRIEDLTKAIVALTEVLAKATPSTGAPAIVATAIEQPEKRASASKKKQREPTPTVAPETPEDNEAPAALEASEPELTHAQVTTWVVDKANTTGKGSEIVKLIKGFGVSRVSDIPLDRLGQFQGQVTELLNV